MEKCSCVTEKRAIIQILYIQGMNPVSTQAFSFSSRSQKLPSCYDILLAWRHFLHCYWILSYQYTRLSSMRNLLLVLSCMFVVSLVYEHRLHNEKCFLNIANCVMTHKVSLQFPWYKSILKTPCNTVRYHPAQVFSPNK